MKLDCPIE